MFFGVQDQGKNSGLSTSEIAEGASDIGSLLCATRMRLGKDLQDVAAVLRIRYTYLVAIEDGRYEDLPGLAYALGFVRAYADYLGLDGEQVVKRFKEESAGIAPAKVYEFPVRAADSGIPSGALLLMAMVMGVFSYGSWYGLTASDRSPIELIQKAPQHLSALLGPRVQEPVTPSAGSAIAGEAIAVTAVVSEELDLVLAEEPQQALVQVESEPSPEPQVVIEDPPVATEETISEVQPEPDQLAVDVVPVEAEAIESGESSSFPAADVAEAEPAVVSEPAVSDVPAAAPEAVTPETVTPEAVIEVAERVETPQVAEAEDSLAEEAEQVASLPDGPSAKIELRATADSWIQVRDGDELVLTRLLREGEVYTVPSQSGLTLMTGNAGGLDVLIDGEPMPPLGDEGVVRRGVPLSPEYFRGLTQESEG